MKKEELEKVIKVKNSQIKGLELVLNTMSTLTIGALEKKEIEIKELKKKLKEN